MIKLILLIYFLAMQEHCFAHLSNVVMVGEHQLVGDPDTLFTLEKLSMGGYAITLNQWEKAQGINTVMKTLTAQLPDDTLAWSEGERMRIVWSTAEQSHVLVVSPLDANHVSFSLSSIRLSILQGSRDETSYRQLKRMLSDSSLNAQLMMDVRDESHDADVVSLLYVSTQPINTLVKIIRHSLKKNDWFVVEVSQAPRHFKQTYSIDAVRSGSHLRLDLVDIGQSFIYVNLSGGLKP
jgi:hypothetical protein